MKLVARFSRRGVLSAGMIVFAVLCMSMPVAADRMTSTSFILNSNANSSFGGAGSSTNYGMFSTGGEPVIGKGASGSYILGGGFTAQTEKSIQLTVQPGGLLGYWNFDETTGKRFVDGSSTRADANMAGTNDSDLSIVSGKIGNGLSGSGAHDDSRILMSAASIQPSSITVSLWVNLSTFNTWDSICSYYAVGSEDWGPWELYTDGDHAGSFLWVVHTGQARFVSSYPTTFATGTWHHVVATYDAATGFSKIYVNGVERGSGTFGANPLNYTVGNNSNQLSCFNSGRWDSEGLRGSLDHLKIFNRALTSNEILAEYNAQNAGTPTGISLGTITPGTSNTALQDVIVRTDSGAYGVTISQDHNLQKGAATIPGVSGSIASPAVWSEGSTKGLGFTLISAPSLDSKWSSGANYAAIPGTTTTFYSRTGHTSSDTIDTLNGRLRLDTTAAQEAGVYSNTVTYTGTTIP